MADLKHMRVLVTPTSFGKSDPGLKETLENVVGEVIYNTTGRPLTADELISLVGDVEGFVAGLDEISEPVIDAAQRLKVISRYGIGVDRVDLAAAVRRGIVVTNTPGANAVAVAELAVGLMIALARDLCRVDEATHRGQWPRYSGVCLRGKTVGLVGLGSIGREVALRLASFGCRLIAADPMVGQAAAREIGVNLVSFDELLSQSDVVSLHAPVTPSTTGLMNRDALNRMKSGAFLINTARGELIDESALKDVLDAGHLGGAALDVFSKEPPGGDHILMGCRNLILTPHMGARTDDAMNQMGAMAVEDCLAALRGERPSNVVNPEVYS